VKRPFFQHLDQGTRCARVLDQAWDSVGGTHEVKDLELEEPNLSGVGTAAMSFAARR
jgi:hypothetical protein